jgi:hypothetical protein
MATRLTGRAVLRAGATALIALVGVGLLGLMMTAVFNLTTGRNPPFDQESPGRWMELGLRSLVAPVVYIAAMLAAVWAARFGVRLLRLSRPFAAGLSMAGDRLRALTSRLTLDDPVVFAQAVSTLGVLGLLVIIWQFADILRACTTMTISNAPAARLLPLRFDLRFAPALYRLSLDGLALILGASLVHIRRLRARQMVASRGAMAPVVALLVLTVLMSEAPYRLLWNNQADRIAFAGERCYVLGQSADRMLIYCPDRTPPRNQVVRRDDPSIQRLDRPPESIFTPPDVQR